ncbi:MAG: OPT/YSL family transporter [Phycisphaerae bacterium]|nr:OPT/YSL family transporter [Phycisphaerae bacterium]
MSGSATTTGESNEHPDRATPPPPPPHDAPFEEREAYWLKHVYQGDRMPQLTLRAVLMGGAIGMLMSVSNLYTVLKVGWLFGVAITACVMSYVIWNLMRALSFGRLSQMSILENACMASTASSAGFSTGSTIGTMFGASLLIQAAAAGTSLRTWDANPWHLVALFTLCTAALGVFIAIPMKRQMINREQLPFPSGIAAAATLKSLYSEGRQAVRQAYALLSMLATGMLVGILNSTSDTYHGVVSAPEKLPKVFKWIDENLFGYLPELWPANGFMQMSDKGTWVDAVVKKGGALADGTIVAADTIDPAKGRMLTTFGFEPSALLIAAGMLIGLRVCLSMLFASALLYFVVAPWLIAQDALNAGVEGYHRAVALNGNGTVFRITVWSLWGGTACMITCSLTALALQWRVVARSFNIFGKNSASAPDSSMEVPFKWFVLGMIPITIALVWVGAVGFSIHWYWGLAAVGCAFVLSLVASRSTGETDTTPIGAMGKVMQLIFGAVQPGMIMPNLASAGIAANGASASSDLLTDLKTGYLLGANPRKQFIAQFLGIFFGTAAIIPAWYLMIPSSDVLETYPKPSTVQWVAVAELLTKGVDFLPVSARWAILFGALVGIVVPIIERLAPRSLKPYVPSAMGLGLAWVFAFNNALAFAIGAIIAWVWAKLSRRTSDEFNVPVASGLIAGEGLIKALIAMSATIVGLSNS